jgi:NADH:ubiquinone oxidoreductase subunit E/NAD-dependent dihydropyrimidine dehydrogenase PreA subunit
MRIGVFICHCGINIADRVDCRAVADYAQTIPGVALATDYKYMCSDPGQKLITDAVSEKKLTGVVVASCSPRMHEPTFRRAVSQVGLNRYLCEMANIREQCSWVHSDREKATAKAMDLVRLMVEKVKKNQPLQEIKVSVTRRALVIGGGIAGIQAALDVAAGGHEVILVEKEPSVGGHMAQLDETFPTLDCSQCILTPRMVDVGQNEKIKLYTYAEVEEVEGYVGNFEVKIRKKARSVDEEKCTGCGVCWNNCPVRNKPYFGKVAQPVEIEDRERLGKTNEIIDSYHGERGALIPILQDINSEYRYLPEDTLRYVAQRLEIPLSQVLHMATFYNAFSLKPRGKHLINVCLGTACHVRGASRILEEIERELGIAPGETTKDLKFTLETVNCLGACALGPLMVIDGEYFGNMTLGKTSKILGRYEKD